MTDGDLLREQIEYDRARADEYDEWFLRQGRYDRGAAHRAEWQREVAVVETALHAAVPGGDVLELACGTGLWTRHLARSDRRVVAVDASPETIAVNRSRVQGAVDYVVADLFAWEPPAAGFDAVFFGFWLSHVPPGQFEPFWTRVRATLKPDGVVFFVDSLREQASTARDHEPLGDDVGVVQRRLNDGRQFNIVKVFYDPAALERRLQDRGWTGRVKTSGRFFLFGSFKVMPGPVRD